MYTGRRFNISDIINKDKSINVNKLKEVYREALKNIPNGYTPQHRLENTPFYRYPPVEEINKANNYLIERENQIVDSSINEYHKRIAFQSIFFLALLILTNIDLRKKEVRLRLKRYRKELLH